MEKSLQIRNVELDESDYLDLLTLRRATNVGKLLETIPRPPNSTPPPGLPIWEKLPLCCKLPVFPSTPTESLLFYREKLGETMWKKLKGWQNFDLYDPLCHEVRYRYEARHDPHLRGYYARKPNRDFMRRMGFITADGKVKCSLSEYNEYRNFLFGLFRETAHMHLWWKDMMERERFQLRRFFESQQKDLKREEKLDVIREIQWKRKMDEEQEADLKAGYTFEEAFLRRKKKCPCLCGRDLVVSEKKKKKRGAKNDVWAVMLQQKAEKLERREQQKIAFFARLQFAKFLARKRAVSTWRKLHDEDLEIEQRIEKQCKKRRRKRQLKNFQRWNLKVQAQQKRLDRERYLLELQEQEIAASVMMRRRNAEMHQKAMQSMMDKLKTARAMEAMSWRDHKKTQKFVDAVTAAWGGKMDTSQWMIEQTIVSTLGEHRTPGGGHDVVAVLYDARDKLTRQGRVPEPVSVAIDALLDSVIREYMRRNIDATLNSLIQRVNAERKDTRRESMMSHWGRRGSEVRRSSLEGRRMSTGRRGSADAQAIPGEPPRARRGSADDGKQPQGKRRPSLSPIISGEDLHLTESEVALRSIRFGRASLVAKISPQKPEMLPTKERPPTPVPSLIDLANAVLEDPQELVELMRIGGSDDKKKQMDIIFKTFHHLVLQYSIKQLSEKAIDRRPHSRSLGRKIDLNRDVVVSALLRKFLSLDNENITDCDEVKLASDYVMQEVFRGIPGVRHESMDMGVQKNRRISMIMRRFKRD